MANETTDQPIVTQQNVITNEADTKTVVGVSGLTLPTPDKVKAIFKMITFFTVVAGVVLNGISTIPPDVKKSVSEYVLVLILILQKAEDFWGIKITN
jgi:hypothetical protein